MTSEVTSGGWDRFAAEMGDRIHNARVARGLSQEALAYRSGLSRYTLQRLEKGLSTPGGPANPTLRTLVSVATVLGMDVCGLMPKREIQTPPTSDWQ